MRFGKTVMAVYAAKAAQKQGKRVLWATFDQAATAEMLAKHGALSEVVGEIYIKPFFRKGKCSPACECPDCNPM